MQTVRSVRLCAKKQKKNAQQCQAIRARRACADTYGKCALKCAIRPVCQATGSRDKHLRLRTESLRRRHRVCGVECALPSIVLRFSMVSIDDRLNQIIRELIANGITLEQAVEAFEGKYIVAAMSASRGNVTQASRALGVHRNTLHNKLRSQSMLNGFADAVRPARRRLSARRVSAPARSVKPRTPRS